MGRSSGWTLYRLFLSDASHELLVEVRLLFSLPLRRVSGRLPVWLALLLRVSRLAVDAQKIRSRCLAGLVSLLASWGSE